MDSKKAIAKWGEDKFSKPAPSVSMITVILTEDDRFEVVEDSFPHVTYDHYPFLSASRDRAKGGTIKGKSIEVSTSYINRPWSSIRASGGRLTNFIVHPDRPLEAATWVLSEQKDLAIKQCKNVILDALRDLAMKCTNKVESALMQDESDLSSENEGYENKTYSSHYSSEDDSNLGF